MNQTFSCRFMCWLGWGFMCWNEEIKDTPILVYTTGYNFETYSCPEGEIKPGSLVTISGVLDSDFDVIEIESIRIDGNDIAPGYEIEEATR